LLSLSFARDLMHIFLLKSILALVITFLVFIAMFTMFEVFGRTEKKYDTAKLKKIHRLNGVVYLLLFLFIAYLCIDFIISTKTELSSRATFHAVFALAVVVLLGVKIAILKLYRQYYGKVQMIGLVIALLTFGIVGTSAGYYLLITKFGTDRSVENGVKQIKKIPQKAEKILVKTDSESISIGKEIYDSKCSFCHDPYSTETVVGPGHKGILKNPVLPVSKMSAIPENIVRQIMTPYKDMPSFAYLNKDEVLNIIAFLNTL
jgi:hypothetical protein